MSNLNYDVELNISYNNTYRHYIPTYAISVPYYASSRSEWSDAWYDSFVSFDN